MSSLHFAQPVHRITCWQSIWLYTKLSDTAIRINVSNLMLPTQVKDSKVSNVTWFDKSEAVSSRQVI